MWKFCRHRSTQMSTIDRVIKICQSRSNDGKRETKLNYCIIFNVVLNHLMYDFYHLFWNKIARWRIQTRKRGRQQKWWECGLTPRSCTRDIVAAAVASSDENKMATRRARSTPWLTCRRSTKSSPRKAFLVARGPKTGLKRSAGRSTGCSVWERWFYVSICLRWGLDAQWIFFSFTRIRWKRYTWWTRTAFLCVDSGVEDALGNLLERFGWRKT